MSTTKGRSRQPAGGIAHGRAGTPPATIEDPAVLDTLRPILRP